ncbi:TDP-N-acetylfucosamine:lipid II N-acetylfucosaminyltransferase [Flavobacterium sp. MAH-1]|uniref:TDP-N-acetylfucosamine:lipid II N-acetylfucosaminyltransferase n=1 Tax=Flavobacterium agri TaxID=2743471 RepID=A0A7Y8Y1M4_9FLAO|nr:TDP-N-acetylfucosamine:lipid II N-acetylfucosaminyltransferase [Flavobacterium agri]NUY80889.1 TDP-N-acetylfucosamine:lipid II N-acetylfucosaminyltransferase [Flavobacterium agri]NYA70913.1 TDP-N-acetylfucosamine:lipid II N-acetylfucosaminyltransferase [Flavobacterium agri]
MAKIIHIFNDDKFIDPAIELFEIAAAGCSEYFVLKNTGEANRYFKSEKVRTVHYKEKGYPQFFVDIAKENEDALFFFHALNAPKQQIVNALPDKTLKVWFVWGYDLYNSWEMFRREMYGKTTRKQTQSAPSFKDRLKVNRFMFFLMRKFQKANAKNALRHRLESYFGAQLLQALKRIDMVVPIVPTEYELVRQMGVSPIEAPFTYGYLEQFASPDVPLNTGKDILVGNSANPTNNHVEAFGKLARLDLGDRKVIVPLSYGGSEEYVAFVIESGKKLLGKNFVPVVDFMPLDAYMELVSNCGVLVFNHIRQQGVGNIIAMGMRGAKLFLNAKSPVYRYYRDIGMHIENIEGLRSEIQLRALSDTEKEHNRQLFTTLYSKERSIEKVKELLQIADAENQRKAQRHK